MTTIRPPVDLETVLVDALEDDATLGPLVGGPGDDARISTRLPSSFTSETRVKVSRVGGAPVGWPEHIDRGIIQTESYGPTDEDAWAVAAGTIVAMAALEGSTVAGGVITAVERVLGPSWVPDPDANNAPRYITQHAVTAHPTA